MDLQTTQNTIVAIAIAYNEQDIICSFIRNCLKQGMDVVVVEDHSTDDTVDMIKRQFSNTKGVGLMTLPTEYRSTGPSKPWDLGLHMKYKCHLARTILRQYTWILHADCDEVYECPWSTSVKEGLDGLSMTVGIVNCTVRDYFPTTGDKNVWPSDGSGFDITNVLSWYRVRSAGNSYNRIARNTESLQFVGGGHRVKTMPPHIHSQNMIMHHFPLRSKELAQKKVGKNRIDRIAPSDKRRGFGSHYSTYVKPTIEKLPIDIQKENECLKRTMGNRFVTIYLKNANFGTLND